MKILLVGCMFYEGSTLLYVSQALSNLGHYVLFWNVATGKNTIPSEEYDLAIVWGNRPLDRNVFKKKVVYIYIDDPDYHKTNGVKQFETVIQGYENVFTVNKVGGYNWLPLGCLKDVHGKINSTDDMKRYYGSDVVFIGTKRDTREKLCKYIFDHLDKKYTFKIWGNDWHGLYPEPKPAYYYQYASVMSNCKIVVTEHYKNAPSTGDCEKPAFGGALMITDHSLIKEEYPTIPLYNNFEELMDIIHYYLEHEDERKKIVEENQHIAFRKFDYETQLKKMIDQVM